jgi:hypothetical protein
MKSSRTIKTQVVSSTDKEISFKLQQEYTPKPMPVATKVNSLVTLTLDESGKVRYHKVCFLLLNDKGKRGRGEDADDVLIGHVE